MEAIPHVVTVIAVLAGRTGRLHCRPVKGYNVSMFRRLLGSLILVALSGHFDAVFSAHAVAEDGQKVVIPFDFVSKFDNGRYGRQVSESIWAKLNREGGFVLPESSQEVRDYCESHHLAPSPDATLDEMRRIVRGDFDAQIGVWGSVERAKGAESDVYDVVIRCVDFSGAGGPKTIYEVKARTKTVSEIPHVYERALLDALYGRTPATTPGPDKAAEEKWKSGPNLVGGGDFESGVGGVPKGWEKVAGQKREPLGKLVKWTSEAGGESRHGENKFIRFSFPSEVGDNEGVMYYSDYLPIEEGAKYRFQCRFRSNGPAVKVFLKCYDDTNTEYRGESAESTQRREVYRCQMNLKGPTNTWNTHTEDFTPRHTKYAPKWGRVMLYAYLGAGQVDFDDVVVKQIVPPSNGGAAKEPRHSAASKVTVKEMEEDERRSREAKEAEKRDRPK